MNGHGILLAAQNAQEKHAGTPTFRADSSLALLRRGGQESGHQHDEGCSQPEEFGRNGEDHGSPKSYGVGTRILGASLRMTWLPLRAFRQFCLDFLTKAQLATGSARSLPYLRRPSLEKRAAHRAQHRGYARRSSGGW